VRPCIGLPVKAICLAGQAPRASGCGSFLKHPLEKNAEAAAGRTILARHRREFLPQLCRLARILRTKHIANPDDRRRRFVTSAGMSLQEPWIEFV